MAARAKAKLNATKERTRFRWLIGTAISVIGLGGAFASLWSLFGPDRFAVRLFADIPNAYEITTDPLDGRLKVLPTSQLRTEVTHDPVRSSAFPKLSLELTNLSPRAIAANAVELRFSSLEKSTPTTITIVLRGPEFAQPDLSIYPVKVLSREGNRLRLMATGGATPSVVAARLRDSLSGRIVTAVVDEVVVPHTEFAKSELADIRLELHRKSYIVRVGFDVEAGKSVRIPISLGAPEPTVGSASAILIYNGQKETVLIPRVDFEILSAPLVEIKSR